jgi:predicted Zn-dependent peptidase
MSSMHPVSSKFTTSSQVNQLAKLTAPHGIIIEKKYDNDFRILYQKSHSTLPITTLYLFCDIGSVFEYDKMRGASHFIEHMCFRGSKKIPKSQKLLKEFSKIGAYFNAFTLKRYTCYTIKCEDIYVLHCLTILSDLIFHSLFKESEYHKEEKVVIEENNNLNNNPSYVIQDTIEHLLYQGSSYEYSIDTLDYHNSRSLEYKNVVDFYHAFYKPDNMFLSIVSNTSIDMIHAMIRKTEFVKTIKRPAHLFMPKIINHNIFQHDSMCIQLIEKKKITNVHLYIGFRTCGRNSKDRYCFDLLSIILGDKLSGRLMSFLRENKALIYNANVNNNYHEYTGDITFSTIMSSANLLSKNGVLFLFIKLLKKLIKYGITEDELQFAKGNFKGAILNDMQNSTNIVIYNGEEYLYSGNKIDSIVPYEKIYDDCISPIHLGEMNDTIRKYFTVNNMCVCILGENLPSKDFVERICKKII